MQSLSTQIEWTRVFSECFTRRILFFLYACLFIFTSSVNATEQEDRQFFEKLLDAGHKQLAAEFLERAENDPLISEGFKQSARFEKLSLGIAKARSSRDAEDREEQLAKLTRQIEGLSKSLKTDSGRTAFARISSDLATAIADDARRSAQSINFSDANSERIKEVREGIEYARSKLNTAENLLEEQHVKLRGVSPDSDEGKTRLDLLGRMLKMRLMSARMHHELAMTYSPSSREFKDLNQKAAKALGALYESYSRWMVGLYAHLYEGQCYRALGNVGLAAGCFEDLIAQPTPNDELRRLVTNAQAQLAALWFESDNPQKSLNGPRRWLSDLSASDSQTPEAAMLQYYLAKSQMAIAQGLPEDDRERRLALRRAGELLSAASRIPSEVQSEARSAWSELGKITGVSIEEADSFEQAFQNGKQTIDQLAAAKASLEQGAELDQAERENLEDQIAQYQQVAANAFQQAMNLADKKTNPKDLNEARYLLAWLTYESGDLSRAASMAEFLLKKAPQDSAAEKSALLGLAALERLSLEGDGEAGKRMTQLANKVVENWPDKEISSTAYNVLLNVALREKDYEAGTRLIAKLPEQKQPDYQLRLTMAKWEALQVNKNADQKERDLLYKQLKASLNKVKQQGNPPLQAVTASLYLARESAARGRVKEAAAFLLDDLIGPVGKLIAKEPPANTQRFATLVAQTAIETYLATGDKRLSKAVQWLEDSLSGSDKEIALKNRLAVAAPIVAKLDASNARPLPGGERQRIVKTLLPIISKAEKIAKEDDWNTRAWVAQTYLKLGKNSDNDETANECNLSAAAAFHDLLDQIRVDPSFAPSPAAAMAVQLQAANCDRELGNYDQALNNYEALLSERQALLEVQTAVAEALQVLGEKQGNSKLLEESINGARPDDDGKNVFWGWRKIAAVTARAIATNETYKEIFFQAWFNVARSRYLIGMQSNDLDAKSHYKKALSTVKAMRRQYPELGGEESIRQYEALEEQIMKGLQ